MPDRWNFDLKLPMQPDPTLDKQMHSELLVIYNSLRLLADQVAGGNMIGWQDIDTSAITIHGFSSLSTRDLVVRYLNSDTVLVTFEFTGVSNSTLTDFELPAIPTMDLYTASGPLIDSGIQLAAPGVVVVSEGVAVAKVYPGGTFGAWTASGAKTVSGQFIYKIGE